MFGFMKKDKDRDRDDDKKRKKDKKENKRSKERAGMTREELWRLDEARKSLIGKNKKKEEKLPSGITANYMDQFLSGLQSEADPDIASANNFQELRERYEALASASSLHSDSSSDGVSLRSARENFVQLNMHPKQSILKITGTSDYHGAQGSTDDDAGVMQNVSYSETYENLAQFQMERAESQSSVQGSSFGSPQRVSNGSITLSPYSPLSPLPLSPSGSHSVSSSISSNMYPQVPQNGQYQQGGPPPLPKSLPPTALCSSQFMGLQAPLQRLVSIIPPGESAGVSLHYTKTFKADLCLPALVPLQSPAPRTLTIARLPAGDFGFSLRRTQLLERVAGRPDTKRTIIFAEPGSVGSTNTTGLLPGDRLLQVNGILVENKSREEIIELIKASADSVTLVVQPVPELSELSVRQSADGAKVSLDDLQIQAGTLRRQPRDRKHAPLARSEEQVAATWLETERVWLVHRGGFCAARLQSDATSPGDGSAPPPGKLALKLEHSGDVIHVDEDDVEKANPSQFDRCEDLSSLRHLNESSVLHTLRQRYGSNLIHTYAGASMVVVNPTTPLAIYSEKVIQMFRGCRQEDMPPHIYSVGQAAYREMVSTRQDQSIVFLGRSGAGKTTNFRHVLHYLALATPSSSAVLTVERLNAISTLLEAFGNSRTLLNTNATRFTQIFSLDYDHTGQIASASIQVYMAEKMRVVRRPEGEPNYHIFYQLLSGADDTLRGQLSLDNLSEPNLFMTPLQRTEDKQKAGIAWARIRAALDVLGVKENEQKALWRVLAAIYHLGVAGTTNSGVAHKPQFARPASADVAAALLGTTIEELTRALFSPSYQPQPRSSFRSISPLDRGGGRNKHWEGLEALEGMASGLYAEAFNAVVALINRCISGSANTVNSVLVVDTPGLQNPGSCGRASGASFADLCHNYTQERLQMLCHDTIFTAQADRYAQEHIECGDVSDALGTPAPLIALIDKPATNSVVRSSQQDLREADRRGLLWLLDEEAIFPGATDQSFLERLFAHYAERDHEQLLQKGSAPDQFVLQHFQGTNPVVYSAQGWLRASRENPVLRQAPTLLQESKKESVSRLFVASRGAVSSNSLVNGPTGGGSAVGIESAQSLRRASSIRRAFTTGTAGIKRRSVALQVKFTVDGIVESLRRTKLRFVHCVLPQHNAGLCELRAAAHGPARGEDHLINIPLVRSQLRGCQLVEALRLHKQGYPEHCSFQQFRRQFAVLAPTQLRAGPLLDHRAATEAILAHLDLDPSSYRLGLSQVLFRTGGLARLEEQRDAVLAGTITQLQARARGVLARRRLLKRRVQETAILCIQKNVRKFLGVREWPWWRLLVRLTPLLDVHRTEHQLREAKTELETLRARLEKVEKEKTTLQQSNDKLEGRLAEVVADLAEEHSTAQLAGERLEAEQADRMRLEKELDSAQSDMRELSLATERLETEKSALRTEMLQHTSSLYNGDIGDTEDASTASLYRRKFEWSQREVESLKQQLRQQQQDDLEQGALLKKQLEKKVADAREETEEQRQVAAQLKKRTQRLQAEMNDLKILLEEQAARNSLLEKKQRKFDSDLAAGQDELRVERLNKEKVMRERDAHLAEKYAVDQELSTLKLELELRDERVAALTKQLDELSLAGQGDQELTKLRKTKHDLESKIKDQEEELDELAGQVQMLEAARTRLEMSTEQLRKESKRELQQREEEVEEVRLAAQKRVKALEAQVEAEHEERTQLVRDKHELERRLVGLMDRSSAAPDDDAVHRLKKDLRKTKALLKDTQTMLEKSQSEGPSKLIIRQLKTQLEDCEFAKTAALKARLSADADLSELQSALDDAQRARKEVEDRSSRLLKEKTELQTQLEEGEELHAETLKKYKCTVSQVSVDQITLAEQSQRIAELEQEKQILSDRLLELSSKVEVLEGETANIHTQRMLQMKVKELESKLELELSTRKRIESQVVRLKEQMERLSGDCDLAKLKETQSIDQTRKLDRQLRQTKEEAAMLQQRNTELTSKRQELEKQMELMDSEIATLKSDLKLAFKRIEDLQMALQGDISDSDSDLSDSGSDSDASLTGFLPSVRASRSAAASSNASPQPNRTAASPSARGEDLMSPGSDAMAIIEEAKEENQHSESFA